MGNSVNYRTVVYLVIHSLSTVGDDAQKAERLRQILGGLRLSGSSRAGRCAAQLHRQRLRQGEIDAVGQRRDDEPSVETHVLVAVPELAGALTDQQFVDLLVPVEAQLALPFELAPIQNAAIIISYCDGAEPYCGAVT